MPHVYVRCKDSDFSEIICSQPALLSSFASSQHQLASSHTQLLLHFPPRTVLSLHTKQPCPAEILTNQVYCYVAGTELLCPGLDYASPFTILNAPSHVSSTPPQHTKLHNLSTLLCLLICARDRWHGQNNIRTLSLHQSKLPARAGHHAQECNTQQGALDFKDSAYSNSGMCTAHSLFR